MCVCWPLKALLVVLCVLPAPPTSLNLLGRCDERAELWSTLEAAVVATTNSLSLSLSEAKSTGNLAVSLSLTQPFIYFTVPVSSSKEHTASLSTLCCCSLLYHAFLLNLRWSLFTSRFAQNGLEDILHCQLKSFHSVSPAHFWLCLPPLPPYMDC